MKVVGGKPKIILTSMEEPLTNAWQKYCGDLDFVEVYQGSIIETKPEAVVSPANSFGFMDGGIDMLYTRVFGWIIQEKLQRIIKNDYDGELLVGQAVLIATDDPSVPFLISAPTMRVPSPLPKTTVNPYLAAKAALRCAINNGISSIAFPGLGTGVGNISPDQCALQVRAAIEEVVLQNHIFPITWKNALDRHTYLYTGLRDESGAYPLPTPGIF